MKTTFAFLALATVLLSMASCNNKAQESSRQDFATPEECESRFGAIDVPLCLSSTTGGIQKFNVAKDSIIILDDHSGKAILSQISAFEIGDNYIGLFDREKLFCFDLPSGQLLGIVSAKGQGPGEYNAITAATIGDNQRFYVLASKWQTANSEIKVYGMDGEHLKDIQIPGFYGDLYAQDPTTLILTGAINSSGGSMPLVRYDPGASMDTIFTGGTIAPGTTFFQTRKIYRRTPSTYYFEEGDTVYSLLRNNPGSPEPRLFLDFKGLKFQNQTGRPIHENNDNGIMLTDLNIFGNNVYARAEKGRQIFYFIYDLGNERIIYSMKVNPSDKKFGLTFNVGGVEFCSWPIAYWNGQLLLPVPDHIMYEIFGRETNPGLLMLPPPAL